MRWCTPGMRNHMLVVPVSAVLRDDKNEPIVYVQSEPGKFAQRSVTIAGAAGRAGGDLKRAAGRAKR